LAWVEALTRKADMGAASARLRITALNQMEEQIAPDEPKDVEWIVQNMAQLCQRWSRRNPGTSPDTIQTYASRARATITEYLRWVAAPDKYKFNSKPESKPTGEKKEKREKRAPEPNQTASPTVAMTQTPANTQAGETRNFPLGEGRGTILFALPPSGVTFADVRKFAVHLFTLATDFNIANEEQAKTFAMVVRGE